MKIHKTTSRAAVAISAGVLLWPILARAGRVVHVDANASGYEDGSCWTDAFTDLQDALDEAQANAAVEEIRVAQGTYLPSYTFDPEASFHLVDGVKLQCGYAGVTRRNPGWRLPTRYKTILSGDLGHDHSCTVVVADPLGGDGAVVDGCIITEGWADGPSGCAVSSGGGMRIVAVSPTISNCLFVENWASGYGGAVAILDTDSRPEFHQCQFVENLAGEGGGAIYKGTEDCIGSLVDHTLVESCFFGNNEAGWGGAIYCEFEERVDMFNSVFSANRALEYTGGAVYMNCSTSEMANCTVFGNKAADLGGGIYGVLFIVNSVLWANSDSRGTVERAQIEPDTYPGLAVNYSCVEDWTGTLDSIGEGNLGGPGDDPRFKRPPGRDGSLGTVDDNFRLRASSPLIDAGSNKRLPTNFVTDTDINGQPRFIDDPSVEPDAGEGFKPIIDIGACERQLPRPSGLVSPRDRYSVKIRM